MALPNRLLALRTDADLTQLQLGAKVGVDPSTIARWETLEGSIPDARKVQLAALFGVSVDHLMCWPEREAA